MVPLLLFIPIQQASRKLVRDTIWLRACVTVSCSAAPAASTRCHIALSRTRGINQFLFYIPFIFVFLFFQMTKRNFKGSDQHFFSHRLDRRCDIVTVGTYEGNKLGATLYFKEWAGFVEPEVWHLLSVNYGVIHFSVLYTKKTDKQYNTKHQRYNQYIILTTSNLHYFQLLHAMLLPTMSRGISLTCARPATAPPPGCLVSVPSGTCGKHNRVSILSESRVFLPYWRRLNVLLPGRKSWHFSESVVQLCCGRSTLTLERFETNYSESLKTSGQETICSWSLPRIAAHLFTRTTSVTVPHSPGQKVILQSIVTFLQLFPPTLSIQSSSALKCANSSLLSLDTVGGLCYRCDCEALGKASLCQRVTHKESLTTSERTRRGT